MWKVAHWLGHRTTQKGIYSSNLFRIFTINPGLLIVIGLFLKT